MENYTPKKRKISCERTVYYYYLIKESFFTTKLNLIESRLVSYTPKKKLTLYKFHLIFFFFVH